MNAPRLPLPALADAFRGVEARYVVTPLDRDGRLADRSVLTLMGWSAGQTVALVVEPGPIMIARDGPGVRIDRRGHLSLPVSVRRTCQITPGDRVLLVADQRAGELLVIPSRAVTHMIEVYRHPPGLGARP